MLEINVYMYVTLYKYLIEIGIISPYPLDTPVYERREEYLKTRRWDIRMYKSKNGCFSLGVCLMDKYVCCSRDNVYFVHTIVHQQCATNRLTAKVTLYIGIHTNILCIIRLAPA